MTFYVAHMRSLAFACRLDSSKKRAMTREGVDFDMKLPSPFEKSSSMKTNTSFPKE